MWLLQHFMKDATENAVVHFVCATENDDLQKE